MKPSLGEGHVHNDRVEQRGLSMLLAALPDPIRREIISARKMSATEIMFRLHQIYQPGGTSERGNLLKNLADPTVGTLQRLRLWRRWLARAEELEVAMPDGLVLLTVLNRIAEVVGKAGAQASFRISSVRQELQVDVRPQIATIKQFSEYLQAEAEELSLATALKTSSTTSTANPAQPAPGLKALAAGTTDPTAEAGEQKKRSFGAPCRFWGTGGGCKKGGSCSYAHSWDGLEKNNRCFGCSGVGSGIARSRKGTGARPSQRQRLLPKCPSLRSRRMDGLLEKALARAEKGPDRLAHRAPRRPGRSTVGLPAPHRRIRWLWVEDHLNHHKILRRQLD